MSTQAWGRRSLPPSIARHRNVTIEKEGEFGRIRPGQIFAEVRMETMTQARSTASGQSLEKVAIFADLSPESLARIQKQCSWRRYDPGESIVDYLDASNDVYLIIAGEARASIYSVDGKAITFTDLGPGEMFGEYAAIDGAPRSATIEARTSCHVASMSGGTFRELLMKEPSLMLTLLERFVGKIRTLTTRVYEFSALAVNNRIQAELLRIAKLAQKSGKSVRIGSAPTHSEIASRISTHREAVTRELNRLSRLGVIERQGSALVVKDVDRLAEMVHEMTGE
jgi:CRP/FNR family cyclic AMP-dependent transcriptional regulator